MLGSNMMIESIAKLAVEKFKELAADPASPVAGLLGLAREIADAMRELALRSQDHTARLHRIEGHVMVIRSAVTSDGGIDELERKILASLDAERKGDIANGQ